MGLPSGPKPLLAILIADDSELIALSCPKITAFKSRSKVLRVLRSSLFTVLAGILATFEITSSISLLPIIFFFLFAGRILWAAPASSIISIALSGSCLSLINFADSSTALMIASDENFTLWCSSNRDFKPLRIFIAVWTSGSSMSTFWNLLVNAWSFSKTDLNSW